MAHLDNMINKLLPLRLYSLTRDTAVYKELSVYAAQLEEISSSAEQLLNELIVATASDYGIYMWENVWGVERNDLTTDQRRNSIFKRLGLSYSKCNLSAMKNFFQSLGAVAEFTEVPERYRIYIYISNGSDFSLTLRNYINAQAKEFLPVHTEFFIDYRIADWDSLDNHLNMFDTLDMLKFTWDRLEHYE